MFNILSLFNCLLAGHPLLAIQSVGVGSMQMAHIYQEDDKKWIRIVYDCGSISAGSNVKIAALSDEMAATPFLHYLWPEKSYLEEKFKTKMEHVTVSTPTKESSISTKNTTPNSAFSMQNGQVIQPDLKEQIVQKVANITDGVDQVLLIVSHLDADHYNLLENITTGYEKITIIMGSDAANKKSKASLFKLDLFRKTKVSIPYLWKLGRERYQEILSGLQTGNTSFLNRSYPNAVPGFKPFIGDLADFKKMEESLGSNDFLSDLANSTLKKLFFLHLNSPDLKDVNGQSIICALTIPEVQTAAFFTGDIEPKTVDYMKDNIESYKKFYEIIDGYYRTVIGWHHGSKNNCTTTMLNFFKPDMMILPAGMGQRFHHPHHHVRKVVCDWVQNQPEKNLFNNFRPKSSTAYTLFFKKNKRPCIYAYNADCPILSTSLSGTLWLTEKGWHQENSPNIAIHTPTHISYYTIGIGRHVGILDVSRDWQPDAPLRYKDKIFQRLSDDHRLIFHDGDEEAIYVVKVDKEDGSCQYYVYSCEFLMKSEKRPLYPSPEQVMQTKTTDDDMDIDDEDMSNAVRDLSKEFCKKLCLTPNNKCAVMSSSSPSPSPLKRQLSANYLDSPENSGSPSKRMCGSTTTA